MSFDFARLSVHILVLVALLALALTHGFPRDSAYPWAEDALTVLRREENDPYGFNSILSRFYKRAPRRVQLFTG